MPRPERPVDPTAGVVQRFAVELRGLRERAGSPGYRELARRAHYSATTLAQAARGDRLPSLQVTQAYVRACGGDPAEWEERWRTVAEEIDPSAIPRNGDDGSPDERPPYVGLAVFGPEDADRFFRRDRLVAKVVARLRRQRLVAVVGASGSGKSSLLRAGLLPVVESGLLITVHRCAACRGARAGSRTRVVLGLRADFFAHCAGSQWLSSRLEWGLRK